MFETLMLLETFALISTWYYAPAIVSSLKDEKRKKILSKKAMQIITCSSPIIISKLTKDKIRKKILNEDIVKMINIDCLLKAISRIKNDNTKYKLLIEDYIYNAISKYLVVTDSISFNDEKYYFKYYEFLKAKNNDDIISLFIKGIRNPKIQTKLILEHNNYNWIIIDIISTLDDEDKEQFLSKLNERNKVDLLITFKNDNLKLKYLDTLTIYNQISIICSLNDAEKLKYLKKPEYEVYNRKIVSSLKDEKIINYLFDKIKTKNNKIEFIDLIKSTKIKEDLYKKLDGLSLEEKTKLVADILTKENNKNKIKELTESINDEKIENIMRESKSKKSELLKDIDITYINPNIDKKITIGIELEISNEKYYIYDKLNYFLKDWKVVNDSTVKDGMEITSPILKYDIDSLKEIYYVCNLLKENDFTENETCGGHLHFGFDYFDDKDELKMLYNIFCNCEDIFYLISNKENTSLRDATTRYARPISGVIQPNNEYLGEAIDLNDLIKKLKGLQKTRYYSINIINALDYTKNTIEFRLPNGEIEYNELLYNIILFSCLITRAKDIAHMDWNHPLKVKAEHIIKNNMDEKTKLEYLLSILFLNNEDLKNVYRKRYYSNNKESEVRAKLNETIKRVRID